MSDSESKRLITDTTLWVVFLSVLISSGTAPLFELFGFYHPLISLLGALTGASLALYEARRVQERINQAELTGTGFAPGFGG